MTIDKIAPSGRTEAKFSSAWKKVINYHRMHKKPVWLVPMENDYAISIMKPKADELPKGTRSNLYNVNEKIIDTVKSSKR